MDATQNDFFNNICCTVNTPVCEAVVTGSSIVQAGRNIIISWTATGAVSYNVFVDGAFRANTTDRFYTVQNPVGGSHTYNIVPICANGVAGTARSGVFVFDDADLCNETVGNTFTEQDENDVLITFSLNGTGGINTSADLYIDGVFYANSSTQAISDVFRAVNFADCKLHQYMVVSKCNNGVGGGSLGGSFQYCAPCNAIVTQSTATKQGDDVILSWTASGAISFDVFVDNVFLGNVTTNTYTVVNGVKNGRHIYRILPKCANGPGTGKDGEWEFNDDILICNATITGHSTQQQTTDVLLGWTGSGAVRFKVYVDNVFKIETTNLSYLVNGGADGITHTYRIEPICANGASGLPANGSFRYNPPVQQIGNVRALPCITAASINGVTHQSTRILNLSGDTFPLTGGKSANGSLTIGTGQLRVACTGNTGSIKATDGFGNIYCQNLNGSQYYYFEAFTIISDYDFLIELDCAPCL